jgi:hypothetical protein
MTSKFFFKSLYSKLIHENSKSNFRKKNEEVGITFVPNEII